MLYNVNESSQSSGEVGEKINKKHFLPRVPEKYINCLVFVYTKSAIIVHFSEAMVFKSVFSDRFCFSSSANIMNILLKVGFQNLKFYQSNDPYHLLFIISSCWEILMCSPGTQDHPFVLPCPRRLSIHLSGYRLRRPRKMSILQFHQCSTYTQLGLLMSCSRAHDPKIRLCMKLFNSLSISQRSTGAGLPLEVHLRKILSQQDSNMSTYR